MEIDVEKELERFEKFALSERLSIAKETFNDHTFFSETETRDVWSGWLAAKKQAMEEMEAAVYQVRFKDPWDADFCAWIRTSKGKMEKYNGWGVETRTLYAKKGE